MAEQLSVYLANIRRELTEEEEAEFSAYFNSSDNEENEEDLNYVADQEPIPSDQSDFGGDVTSAILDPRFQEYTHEEPIEEIQSTREERIVELSTSAIERNRGEKYLGQGRNNRTVWWSKPSEEEKLRTHLAKNSRELSTAICTETFANKSATFMRVFPVSLVESIVLETNRKAKRIMEANLRQAVPKKMRYWSDTNADEMYAFIAIVLYAGAEKANLVQGKDLFDKMNMPFYRAVMSLYRFEQLSRFMRFDDSRTRAERLRYDKLAPIRHVWTMFLSTLTASTVAGKELCVDEQLLSTRNRCSFRQYIPSKPGKYGIKIFWLVDAKTNYPLAGEIYLGSQPNEARAIGVGREIVKRLSNRYMDNGANITMDNFFTSYELADELLSRNTTIVGTIRGNKPQLPKLFTSAEEAKKRGVFASVFCYSQSLQLVSFTSHSKKNVLLLSTAHAGEDVNAVSRKPEVIIDYNKYKGGVDTFDKMLRGYTCKRKTNRWPMAIFYNMVDVAGLAAFRLFELDHPMWNSNNSEKRKFFLKELAMELAQNQLNNRCKTKINSNTKTAMDLIGFKREIVAARSRPTVQVNTLKRRCETCKKVKKDNKTTAICDHCLAPTCTNHYVRACESCHYSLYNSNTVSDSSSDEESPRDPTTSTPNQSTSKRQRRISPI